VKEPGGQGAAALAFAEPAFILQLQIAANLQKATDLRSYLRFWAVSRQGNVAKT